MEDLQPLWAASPSPISTKASSYEFTEVQFVPIDSWPITGHYRDYGSILFTPPYSAIYMHLLVFLRTRMDISWPCRRRSFKINQPLFAQWPCYKGFLQSGLWTGQSGPSWSPGLLSSVLPSAHSFMILSSTIPCKPGFPCYSLLCLELTINVLQKPLEFLVRYHVTFPVDTTIVQVLQENKTLQMRGIFQLSGEGLICFFFSIMWSVADFHASVACLRLPSNPDQ